MISLIYGIQKIQQTSEYNKKETDSLEKKLVVASGKREREGEI